ncbi:uncharacterized protein MKK02DRAFT_34251 [Dioszegia hungarica]|uniref:THIF-type NAD/FAD binding fold domain-containing protein n=1 Tax=Dioszegia hungarica TaxID=4972 RepID=A0AA38LTD6_9TREE|nr:uncharacterized protein MKK02DRAFT_34251 [Dioszegia hungarica]KAI9634650.1 hypothetical protein MKK02DRAFT_34251 [Dioszegia hungarica]
MRSSTILLLSLRSLAHETIKNLVLAGIGRMIIMDDGKVTEEDLSGGFLFREEEGAVGKLRTEAALPQIASLNPLVSLSSFPTLSPFVQPSSGDNGSSLQNGAAKADMLEFLKREKVDVVVACDMTRSEIESINAATRDAKVGLYAAGSYGYYGYVFADLGQHDFVVTPPSNMGKPASTLLKKSLSYVPFEAVLDRSGWAAPFGQAGKGGSPFRGMSRTMTKERAPGAMVGLLSLWEFERRHGDLPSGKEGQVAELGEIAEELRSALGIHLKALPQVEGSMIEHLGNHATAFFPPTLAILGGCLAQDVLRAISKKDKPIGNLLVVDSWGGQGAVARWGMEDMRDA